MFQLLTEERGPWKLQEFMAQGTPGLVGPALLVQSQRRQRFLTTMLVMGSGGFVVLWIGWLGTDGVWAQSVSVRGGPFNPVRMGKLYREEKSAFL